LREDSPELRPSDQPLKINDLTFYVTEECNFCCSYCYQKRGQLSLSPDLIREAVDFFSPYFAETLHVNFYGGEPLLSFDLIDQALRHLRSKTAAGNSVVYSLATNGSLLSGDILSLLNEFGFRLLLSFDGHGQDITRKKGSFKEITKAIEKLQAYPKIQLETQSVFVPETIHLLSGSIKFILELGIRVVNFNLDYVRPWSGGDLSRFKQELGQLRGHAEKLYHLTRSLPVRVFEKSEARGLLRCKGGQENMVLAPDGTLWGCVLLYDYARFKESEAISRAFCFGSVEQFIRKRETAYPRVLRNYSRIRQEVCRSRSTRCRRCLDLLSCGVCPVAAAFGSRHLGEIPEWVCAVGRIMKEENRAFWRDLGEDL
jgi:sulfatase maturation enzyme AslB (radical SAM superfamily)